MNLKDLLGDAYKDGMTLEEVDKALGGVKLNDDAELKKVQQMYQKASSEAAEYKKQLRAKQTDEEAQKAKQEEELSTMKAELETFKKQAKVASYKTSYVAMGYDEKLAEETANAMYDGDMDKVFANQQKFIGEHDKQLKAESLKNMQEPNTQASGGTAMTLEKLQKMTPQEQMTFAKEHQQEYKALYGVNN